MSENFGSLLKNILPGLALVAIGTGGALLVYKTSFQQQVADGFADIEPIAGYTMEVDAFGSRVDMSWLDGETFPPAPEAIANTADAEVEKTLEETIQNIESAID